MFTPDWDNADSMFELASLLISHSDRRLVHDGRRIMSDLRQHLQAKAELLNATQKATLIDAMFFEAVAYAKIDELSKANATVEAMLAAAPTHPQGLALKQRLEHDLMMLGLKGAVGLAAGIAASWVFLKLVRK